MTPIAPRILALPRRVSSTYREFDTRTQPGNARRHTCNLKSQLSSRQWQSTREGFRDWILLTGLILLPTLSRGTISGYFGVVDCWYRAGEKGWG